MTERNEDEVVESSSYFDLVLNTWLISYLHGELPGGSPADFLTRGASALLVFDHVLCDENALKADEPFVGTWLSSDLISELRRSGIVKPVNLSEHIPAEFMAHLRDTGLTNVALKAMETQVAAIKSGEIAPDDLRLPEFLTWLNHYMFLGLELPSALLYEWQESHFKLPSVPPIPQTHQEIKIDQVQSAGNGQKVMSVLKALLPEFNLLPPLSPDSEAAALLQANIGREKGRLYRWICGDPEVTQADYQEWRLSPSFRIRDKQIDDVRRAQAWHNFEILLKVREETKDIRAAVQGLATDVVAGRKPLEEVQEDLGAYQQELLSHLPHENPMRVDVGLAGAGLAISVAGSLSGLIPPAIGISIAAIDIISAAWEVWNARQRRIQYQSLRKDFPLAFFLRDFRDIREAADVKFSRRR